MTDYTKIVDVAHTRLQELSKEIQECVREFNKTNITLANNGNVVVKGYMCMFSDQGKSAWTGDCLPRVSIFLEAVGGGSLEYTYEVAEAVGRIEGTAVSFNRKMCPLLAEYRNLSKMLQDEYGFGSQISY